MGEDKTVCNINKCINNSNGIPTVYNIFACQIIITQTSNNKYNSFIMTW